VMKGRSDCGLEATLIVGRPIIIAKGGGYIRVLPWSSGHPLKGGTGEHTFRVVCGCSRGLEV